LHAFARNALSELWESVKKAKKCLTFALVWCYDNAYEQGRSHWQIPAGAGAFFVFRALRGVKGGETC
jgi:hypothetical protein